MKKLLSSVALLVMCVGVLRAQVNNNKVIIHIGGQEFSINGDIDLGEGNGAQKFTQGDSTIIKLPNITIITDSKTHTKEIYINGGTQNYSSGTGNYYWDLGKQMDSMFANKHWGMNIPDSDMFYNIPNFSFKWNWGGNFPGNMDSIMQQNKKWMDSINNRNWNNSQPKQFYYYHNDNNSNDTGGESKQLLQEKIQELKDKISDMQDRMKAMSDELQQSKNKSNSSSYTPEDSTKIRIGNFKILINENGVKFNSDSSYANTSCKPHQSNVKTHWLLLDLGFNTYLSNFTTGLPVGYSGLELEQGKSVNVNLHLFQQSINLVQQLLFFEYGVSFEFNNYRFRQNNVLIPKIDSVKFAEAPTQLSKYKLSDTYLTIPVMFQYESNKDFANSFRFGLGMSMGYLITSHTKEVSSEYGKVKVWDNFDLNTFRYGPTLRIGYSWFNLYVNYSLDGLFRTGSAPLLNPLSFGISIIAD